ncbi:hypothetical protein B0T21DRAFT_345935 [Apiosordaria backusii]|uniref:Uncharacterized protein n=1 Tax=Apiosordaria backusii TaxID=314023 RepID=A0AA40EMI7_9PEZI|nr:hypothetical protein B0T21DRAFT_345935 [Apiosordaria backusii]
MAYRSASSWLTGQTNCSQEAPTATLKTTNDPPRACSFLKWANGTMIRQVRALSFSLANQRIPPGSVRACPVFHSGRRSLPIFSGQNIAKMEGDMATTRPSQDTAPVRSGFFVLARQPAKPTSEREQPVVIPGARTA